MRSLVALVVFFALLTAACGSSDGQEAAEPAVDQAAVAEPTAVPEIEPTSPPAPTPEPTIVPEPTATVVPAAEPTSIPERELELIGDGPYEVGVTTVTIDTDTTRPLTVDIWFPLSEGADGDAARYTFLTGDFYESPRAITADAESIADGPFPLIVYSHGSGGVRFVHSDYTEVLASHGYVVAAPDHTGNTSVEQFLGVEDGFEEIAVNRPNDVISVIDAMTDPTDQTTAAYASAIAADSIAVTGHSFGGFTSYAVVSGYENGFGSSPADDRVDAIIPLAPAVGPQAAPTLLTDEMLALVDVPALVMVGTDDKTTPVDPNVERAWSETSSSPHYRLELVAAEHQSFTDVCDYLAAFDAGQEVSEPVREVLEDFGQAGCSIDDMPTDRVQELTNTFAIRFLESIFVEGEMIEPADVAAVDDIIYASK